MKNKQRTSTKVIISYNDGSTYTFTNVSQIGMDYVKCKVSITQIRNKDKFICEEVKTTIKLTHVKEVTYLPKNNYDTTYKVINGQVVEKVEVNPIEPITQSPICKGLAEGTITLSSPIRDIQLNGRVL